MADAMQVSDLADLLNTTYAAILQRDKRTYADWMADFQNYHAVPHIFKEKAKVEDGGHSITFVAAVRDSGTAEVSGPYDHTDVQSPQKTVTGNMRWGYVKAVEGWDERELAINSGSAKKLVDIIRLKRNGMHMSHIALGERLFWIPKTSDDGLTPFSVWNYVPRCVTGTSAAAEDGGFNGGDLWAGEPVAGITHAKYKNYAHQYVLFTEDDLFTKWTRAFRRCGFESPIPHKGYDQGKADFVFYVTEEGQEAVDKYATHRNDNMRNDIARMADEAVFKNCPIRWVSMWEDDATIKAACPILGINWKLLYPVFMKGFNKKETPPHRVGDQSLVRAIRMDSMYNIVCHSRRGLFVLSKS